MGSNGLTSARHDVFNKAVGNKYPETYDHAIDAKYVYSGSKSLTGKPATGNHKLDDGKLVLSPTRTYAPIIKKIFETHRSKIHGMVHCSGGGQTKVLHFVDSLHIIKDNLFPLPPLFKLIQEESTFDYAQGTSRTLSEVETHGKKCIRCLTWGIGWKFIVIQRMLRS